MAKPRIVFERDVQFEMSEGDYIQWRAKRIAEKLIQAKVKTIDPYDFRDATRTMPYIRKKRSPQTSAFLHSMTLILFFVILVGGLLLAR